MPARKLKVFQAQLGFYDTVVSAPSQAAALRAWGVRQNMFASGDAKIATDEAAVATALAHPQTPLRRAVGSSDPFQLQPAHLPTVPEVRRPSATKESQKSKTVPPPKPKADRTLLDAAEGALRKFDEARQIQEADFRRRQDELDAAKSAAQRAYVDGRKTATAAIAKARTAYRQAGGD